MQWAVQRLALESDGWKSLNKKKAKYEVKFAKMRRTSETRLRKKALKGSKFRDMFLKWKIATT